MRIITQYLTKEITITMSAVTLILLFIFMCNNLVRYLGMVSRGKFAFWVLMHLILLQVPITLGLLLPMGLFIGILLSYGRLYVDSEMTVLFACGYNRKQFIMSTMGIALIIAIISTFFSFWVLPAMELRIQQVFAEAKSGSVLDTITPGKFQVLNNGNSERVYYVQKISRGHKHVEQVFSAERTLEKGKLPSPWEVIVAKRGEDKFDPKTANDYFQMDDGQIYKGIPGEKSFHVVAYKTYGIRSGSGTLKNLSTNPRLMKFSRLLVFARFNKPAMAELQWRISIPLAVLLLAFLAIPLSRIRPRQGRYAKFLPAIIIFIIYFNLLMLARGWVGSGRLPVWLGMWWVHGLLLLLGLAFHRSQGSWRIWRKADIA